MEALLTLTTDGAGAAAKDTETPIRGYLEAIQVASYGAAPGTTTITITENDTNRAILAVPAGNTPHVSYVRAPAVNLSDAAIASSWVNIFLNHHSLHVVIASGGAGSVIVLRFIWSDIG